MSNATTTSFRSLASNLIVKNGRALIYRRSSQGTYNPDTGLITQLLVDSTVYGVIQSYKAYRVDGATIQIGDRQVLLPAKDMTSAPQPGDQILTSDSEVWTILNIDTTYHSDLAVLYDCQVRR